MRRPIQAACTLLAAAAFTVGATATQAQAAPQTRTFDVSTTGSRATGTITWDNTTGEATVDGGTVYDTVRDGASGVAFARYRLTLARETNCTPVGCQIVTDTIEDEQQIGRVSTGVGTDAPISSFQVPPPPPESGRLVGVGLWVRVCTIDFSEGGATRSCSGLG
jgi:hypothetical protein